jgi:hypothetical protein
MKPLSLNDIVAFKVRREMRSRMPQQLGFSGGGPQVSSVARFDALNNSPNRTPAPTGIPEAISLLVGGSYNDSAYRESLCGLSRWLADNYGSVWYAIDLIARYSAPVIPKAVTVDKEWNQQADAYFEAWSLDSADFYGASDFATLSRLACIHIDMDGDLGAMMSSDGGAPQLRLVPSWRIGSPYSARNSAGDGVVLDALGRIVGFEIREAKNDSRVVDRNQMILLAERERMERFRGLSPLRRGSNDVRDARDILGFEKLATKMESAMAGVIEGPPQVESDWGDPAATSPGMAGSTSANSVSLAKMLGGEIPVIDGKFVQLESNRPGTNKVEFLDVLAGNMCSGLGLPPSFLLDMKFGGPNQRAVIGKAQRKFDGRKAELGKLARFAWVRVIADAINRGALPAQDGWTRCRLQGPKEITIDLGDQSKADRDAVMNGLMSRQRYFAKNNEDFDDETGQIIGEIDTITKKLKPIADQSGVSMDVLLQYFGFAKSQPEPQPAPVSQ